MYFNFYGQIVQIKCAETTILERIAKDFSYFCSPEFSEANPFLTIDCYFETVDKSKWDYSWKKSKNCHFCDFGYKRFYRYDQELWGEVDFKQEKAQFYSKNIHLLHEVVYLYLLSRLGKKLESLGLYKIHACAFAREKETYLFPMLMKGGKSTLFLGCLSAAPFEILSDDAPLVTAKGEVLPFPIRVGLELSQNFSCYDSSNAYILERRRFGKKYLIDIADFKNVIAKNTASNSVLLFQARRTSFPGCSIEKASRLKLTTTLFINMVVGLGLPYAREFYLENSLSDYWRLFKIAFGRLRASLFLLFRAQCFSVQLGNVPEMNAECLANFRSHDSGEDNKGSNQTCNLT